MPARYAKPSYLDPSTLYCRNGLRTVILALLKRVLDELLCGILVREIMVFAATTGPLRWYGYTPPFSTFVEAWEPFGYCLPFLSSHVYRSLPAVCTRKRLFRTILIAPI